MNRITTINELDSYINWLTSSGTSLISTNHLKNQMNPEIYNLYVLYTEATQLFQAGNYSAAIRSYTSILKIAPDFVAALNNLSNLYRVSGNPLSHFFAKRSVVLAPEDVDLCKNLGDSYDDIMDVENAIHAYKKVAAKVKSHPIQGIEALINLSVNLHRKNLFEEAEQYLIYALNFI